MELTLHRIGALKIPWYIVVPTSLVTIYGTWVTGTRHYDFLTPENRPLPPEDFGADLVSGIPKANPVLLPPPAPAMTDLAEPQKAKQITTAELGPLTHSPGLSEYQHFAKKEGAARTLDLSSKLQTLGQSQRAMLALERVIDSTIANLDETAQAAAGITALAQGLPKWNIDPSAEITLTLHLTTASKAPESLKKAVLSVATQIREASGDQLNVIPKITSGDREEPSNAVTLQITAGGNGPVLTLNSLYREGSTATDELAKIVFRMVRLQLTDLGYPMPAGASPRDLSEGMTRLMWRDYAHTLLPPQKKAPQESLRFKKGERPQELY